MKAVLDLQSKGDFNKTYKEINSFNNKIKLSTKSDFLKGRVVYLKGRLEIDLGYYDEAILSANNALRFYKNSYQLERANAFNLIGIAKFHKSEVDSALFYYKKNLFN